MNEPFQFQLKDCHKSYRFNEGSDTWDFNMADRKLSECLPILYRIESEYERIECNLHSAIPDRKDLSTLIEEALLMTYYPQYEHVVERFAAVVDYLRYITEIYENDGVRVLITIEPKPYKIIENELVVPITTHQTRY